MPIIYSGNQNDQNYSSAYKRLVKQSNRARESFPDGVNPTVKGWLDGMHQAGILGKLGGGALWLPDMYTADAENRVSQMGGLTAAGALAQATGANQPHLTRADERSNLLLQSVWPGSGDEPDGWNLQSGGGSLVAGTDGHQNYTAASTTILTQNKSVLNGQRYLLAVRAEVAASSTSTVVGVSGVSASTLASFRDMAQASDGDWVWLALNVNANGGLTAAVTIGAGDELSRPVLAYLPANLDTGNNAEVQTWLTDHYAATTDVRQYAGGPGGTRVVQSETTHHFNTDGFRGLGSRLYDGISITALVRRNSTRRCFLTGAINDGSTTAYWVGFNDTSDNQLAFFLRNENNQSTQRRTTGSIPINDGAWHLVTWRVNGSGQTPYLFLDGAVPSQNSAEIIPDNFVDSGYDPYVLAGNNRGPVVNNYDGGLGALLINDGLITLDQHAALHEILTGA